MSLKSSKFLFIFLLVFCPLAFGTTEAWSYAVMEIGAAVALCFFTIWLVKDNQTVYQVPGLLPFSLFLLYILFHLIPLPPSIVGFLSPETYKIHSSHILMTGSTDWMPLSVNVKATLSDFFRYSTYFLYYILSVQLLSKKGMLQGTVWTIAIFGGMLAFSSILQFYMTEDMALWFRHVPQNSIVVGPYVNHNHYAGLMGMIFPIVLGLFLFYRPRIGNTSMLKGIAEIFNQEKANIHILVGTSALLVVISIFVSLSRGAMISTCVSLIVFTYLLLKRRISKSNTIVMIVVIMISALSIGWFGWDQILERFSRLKNAHGVIHESRLDFWSDTKEIIKTFPVTGTGMGTFSDIYPSFRNLKNPRMLYHAHNDYLEMLVEGGLIGFFLCAWFLFAIFLKTYKIFLTRRDGFSVYLYIGSFSALTYILTHSFTDFNLQIGANGLWFFLCAGILVSAANTGVRRESLETRLLPVRQVNAKYVMFLMVFGLTALTIVYNASHLLGRFYYSNIKNFTLRSDTPEDILLNYKKVAALAGRFDPFQSRYQFSEANASYFLNDFNSARKEYVQTLDLAPLNSRHISLFARFLAKNNEFEKASKAFEMAAVYDRSNAKYAYAYAAWLFAEKKPQQGLTFMEKALTIDETLIGSAITLMIRSGLNQDEIQGVIPKTPDAYIAYSQFLFDTGRNVEAIENYLSTLDLIEKQQFPMFVHPKDFGNIKRSQFFKISGFFSRSNNPKYTLQVLNRAEKHLPMDALIKVALGDFYYKQGILYLARDKYDHALLLDPKNRHAANMLKKISP